MPNTGKPSKDCQRCRKRRVKCTLERPECQRCTRLGLTCPGYRDEQSLMFRHEDLSSLGGPSAVKDRRRSRLEHSPGLDSSTDTTPPFETPSQTPPKSDWRFGGITLSDLDPLIFVGDQLSPDRSAQANDPSRYAVSLVLALFSFDRQAQRHFSHFEILPQLLAKSVDQSPLTMCCEALGFAFLANRFNSPDAKVTRDRAYGRALAATNTLVGDPESCRQDEVSLSVWLLSIYEVVAASDSSFDTTHTASWKIHAQGQIELLRLRGQHQLQTPIGRKIFWMLAMSCQIRCLITGDAYPPFIQEWLTTARHTFSERDLRRCALSDFASHLSTIGVRIQKALTVSDPEVSLWTFKDIWNQIVTARPTVDQVCGDPSRDKAKSLETLYIANLHRAFYTKILQKMFDLAECLQSQGIITTDPDQLEATMLQIRTTVSSLASDTLSTALMVLSASAADQTPNSTDAHPRTAVFERPICWADILKLLWPLRIIRARKKLLNTQQVEVVEGMLQQISDDFCIRQAVAPYNVWDPDPDL